MAKLDLGTNGSVRLEVLLGMYAHLHRPVTGPGVKLGPGGDAARELADADLSLTNDRADGPAAATAAAVGVDVVA